MAITVKSLNNGNLGSVTDQNLYPAGSNAFAQKAAVVKNVRFVNTSGSGNATVLLKLKQDSPSITRQLTTNAIIIPPNACLVLNEEITLEGNAASSTLRHAILVTSTGALDYVVSGIERD